VLRVPQGSALWGCCVACYSCGSSKHYLSLWGAGPDGAVLLVVGAGPGGAGPDVTVHLICRVVCAARGVCRSWCVPLVVCADRCVLTGVC
jgi:hypothetical protein